MRCTDDEAPVEECVNGLWALAQACLEATKNELYAQGILFENLCCLVSFWLVSEWQIRTDLSQSVPIAAAHCNRSLQEYGRSWRRTGLAAGLSSPCFITFCNDVALRFREQVFIDWTQRAAN